MEKSNFSNTSDNEYDYSDDINIFNRKNDENNFDAVERQTYEGSDIP